MHIYIQGKMKTIAMLWIQVSWYTVKQNIVLELTIYFEDQVIFFRTKSFSYRLNHHCAT